MYSKYFFNFEDPEVIKDMTDKKRGPKIWKKTYGYDFASVNANPRQPVRFTECIKYCYKAERKRFARKCRRDGGFFKCCLSK